MRWGWLWDCGPGLTVPDAIRLAKALEPLNVMWLEDMITGDYVPYVFADLYREVTSSTVNSYPYRRTDLPSAEFQRPHRKACRGHHRT